VFSLAAPSSTFASADVRSPSRFRPAWKITWQRKASVKETTLSDIQDDREFRHCDW
jgi:hypothetical protein